MSITITGGISFSGGVGIVAPPPTAATAGWVGAGGGYTSTVQRITFATDTATATVRGPLNRNTNNEAATGDFTYGWFGGGNLGPPTYNGSSIVGRITYATDTATAATKGPLSLARYTLAATGTSSYGWFAGGNAGGGALSRVDRIDFANDTATASVRGTLTGTRQRAAGVTDSTTYGWFGGGYGPTPGVTSIVDRIIYATDTATATSRGPLSQARQYLAGTNTSTYGWFGGGDATGPGVATVNRIDYSNDTIAASVRGTLSSGRWGLAASGDNTTYGWYIGGNAGPAVSIVDRVTFATDTATAGIRGPLASATSEMAASSGIQ